METEYMLSIVRGGLMTSKNLRHRNTYIIHSLVNLKTGGIAFQYRTGY